MSKDNMARADYWDTALSSVPKKVTDAVLRFGSGKRNSRRNILLYVSSVEDKRELQRLVKKEYERFSLGVIVDGRQYAAKCDSNGMHIARGKRALSENTRHAFYTYEELTEMISVLVKSGRYAAQSVIDDTKEAVADSAADLYVWNIRDVDEKARAPWNALEEKFKEGKYNFSKEKVKKCLLGNDDTDEFISCLAYINRQGLADKSTFRFPFVGRNIRKIEETASMLALKKPISAADPLFTETDTEIFITDDEAETFLLRGREDGYIYRTYSYFTSGHSDKDNADFLKHIFGTGGSHPGVPGTDNSSENHDNRGVVLEKGKDDSYDSITRREITWNEAASVISGLISQGKLLSTGQKEGLDEYEKMHFARAVYNFFSYLPEEKQPIKTSGLSYCEDEKRVSDIKNKYFSSKEKMQELLILMKKSLCDCQSEYRFENMKNTIKNFHNFIEGTYTLFPKKDDLPKYTGTERKTTRDKSGTVLNYSEQMSIFDFI